MSSKILFVLLLSFSLFCYSQEGEKTVQDCAKHLPAGYKYKYEITGEIDTAESMPKVEGKFVLIVEEPGVEEDIAEARKVFANCVFFLFKENPKQYY